MAISVSQLSRRAQRASRACVSGQRLTQLITVVSGNRDGVVFRVDRLAVALPELLASVRGQCEVSEKDREL